MIYGGIFYSMKVLFKLVNLNYSSFKPSFKSKSITDSARDTWREGLFYLMLVKGFLLFLFIPCKYYSIKIRISLYETHLDNPMRN